MAADIARKPPDNCHCVKHSDMRRLVVSKRGLQKMQLQIPWGRCHSPVCTHVCEICQESSEGFWLLPYVLRTAGLPAPAQTQARISNVFTKTPKKKHSILEYCMDINAEHQSMRYGCAWQKLSTCMRLQSVRDAISGIGRVHAFGTPLCIVQASQEPTCNISKCTCCSSDHLIPMVLLGSATMP